jgi:pseudouridylate synthase
MQLHPEVAQALLEKKPIVALESTVITHGLPRPTNFALGQTLENTVRRGGAIPATIAVLDGQVYIGLTSDQLETLAHTPADKASLWNLGALIAGGKNAGTTVAATMFLAHKANISVFATGGIGGVHRHPFDESADLTELSRTPLLVVCAGPKSILDLEATLERLESLGVGLLGYGCDFLPAFYAPQSPYKLPSRVDSPEEAVGAFLATRSLGLPASLVLKPISAGLDYAQVQRWVEQATHEAARKGVQGKAVTPFLLNRLNELSGGETLKANLTLLEENSALAAAIAVHLSQAASIG